MRKLVGAIPLLTIDSDGDIRVAGTRVTLGSVVGALDMGATPEEIVYMFPALDLKRVHEVIALVVQHRESFDKYLARR